MKKGTVPDHRQQADSAGWNGKRSFRGSDTQHRELSSRSVQERTHNKIKQNADCYRIPNISHAIAEVKAGVKVNPARTIRRFLACASWTSEKNTVCARHSLFCRISRQPSAHSRRHTSRGWAGNQPDKLGFNVLSPVTLTRFPDNN
ncbi:hypothetical protein EVAR_75933_1 [Eumeta japonica]|uniref:Uncharacterized protein n=1 Tax=Eumeta variegata TaxID=151549 RepID=A0A4C1UWR2_EUMVA|nr:hypothetical protein EVAR_75933_1 [Eumeta japonica]